jgi:hypothetical protein
VFVCVQELKELAHVVLVTARPTPANVLVLEEIDQGRGAAGAADDVYNCLNMPPSAQASPKNK